MSNRVFLNIDFLYQPFNVINIFKSSNAAGHALLLIFANVRNDKFVIKNKSIVSPKIIEINKINMKFAKCGPKE